MHRLQRVGRTSRETARLSQHPYRGRFAPAPTGDLHFGSVVTAVASWLRARQAGGEWWVRIEDLDTIRATPGADRRILASLDRLGLHWDGPVTWQSERNVLYRRALTQIEAHARCYPCACSRREVGGARYPGNCRTGLPPGKTALARRLDVRGAVVSVTDALQGTLTQDLDAELGDFVIQRGDGLIAYHLAVVVDDADQGMTEIVRGADIWEATPRQAELQACLGLPAPQYVHIPVAVAEDGRKLSKQNLAPMVEQFPAHEVIADALRFLGLQEVPASKDPAALLHWARARWTLAHVPPGLGHLAPARYCQ